MIEEPFETKPIPESVLIQIENASHDMRFTLINKARLDYYMSVRQSAYDDAFLSEKNFTWQRLPNTNVDGWIQVEICIAIIGFDGIVRIPNSINKSGIVIASYFGFKSEVDDTYYQFIAKIEPELNRVFSSWWSSYEKNTLVLGVLAVMKPSSAYG